MFVRVEGALGVALMIMTAARVIRTPGLHQFQQLRFVFAPKPSQRQLVKELPIVHSFRECFKPHALFGAFLEIPVLRHDRPPRLSLGRSKNL